MGSSYINSIIFQKLKPILSFKYLSQAFIIRYLIINLIFYVNADKRKLKAEYNINYGSRVNFRIGRYEYLLNCKVILLRYCYGSNISAK